MKQPKISIIVPVYNVERYLERCINSLVGQTLEEIEILLVDDGSTDRSPELCEKAAAADKRIKVLRKKNEGAGLARNAALKVATGEYIGFVDSDDYVAPDMFESLLKKAEQYGSDLVLSGVLFVDGNMFSEAGDSERRDFFDGDTQFETTEALRELRMGIVGAAPGDPADSKYGMSIWKNLFRRDVILENNIEFQSEREMLSEDALFMVDYIGCIKKATGIREAYYYYCRNGSSISKSYKKDRFEKSLVFMREVENRFSKDMEPEMFRMYTDRFWQAMCRVLCTQEILHAADEKLPFRALRKRLESVCTHEFSRRAFSAYPLRTLPFMQSMFAHAMKYRQYYLLKLLVLLRKVR